MFHMPVCRHGNCIRPPCCPLSPPTCENIVSPHKAPCILTYIGANPELQLNTVKLWLCICLYLGFSQVHASFLCPSDPFSKRKGPCQLYFLEPELWNWEKSISLPQSWADPYYISMTQTHNYGTGGYAYMIHLCDNLGELSTFYNFLLSYAPNCSILRYSPQNYFI